MNVSDLGLRVVKKDLSESDRRADDAARAAARDANVDDTRASPTAVLGSVLSIGANGLSLDAIAEMRKK